MVSGELWRLIDDDALERIAAGAERLLAEAGARVEHEGILGKLAARGCTVDASTQHCRFTPQLIAEATGHYARQEARNRPEDPLHFRQAVGWDPARPVRLAHGGSNPHLLDWPSGERRLATSADVAAMAKMAHVLDEFAVVGQVLTASDVDSRVEPVWNVVRRMELTDKPVRGGEVMHPENVKHLVRLGEIETGRPGCVDLVPACNFIISPLRYNRRALACMVEKMRFGVRNDVGSMPVSGMSAPVTVAGTAALMLAEVVGGWCISYVIDPDVAVGAGFASGSMDMRSANAVFGSPEAVLQDLAVSQCCRRLYGIHSTWCAFNYVDCKTPGIQAAIEKLMPLSALPLAGALPFYPDGLLSAGQDYSPVQHLMEFEVANALDRFMGTFEVTDETLALDLLAERAGRVNASFLETDHTLAHYAGEQYYPRWLDRSRWQGTETERRAERDMLERVDRYWKDAAAAYEQPEIEPAKLRAARQVLEAARQEAPSVETLG
ncbi:MAG: trimethylamine methyltransferase family protein [Candidatus Brocadiia bacterium]